MRVNIYNYISFYISSGIGVTFNSVGMLFLRPTHISFLHNNGISSRIILDILDLWMKGWMDGCMVELDELMNRLDKYKDGRI